jgi:leucine-rich repeat-containing protein 49
VADLARAQMDSQANRHMISSHEGKKRASSHGSTTATNKNQMLHSSQQKLMIKPDSQLIQKLLQDEKDDRYRYLLKQGTIHSVEAETHTIFVELKQIPSVLVIYRRPVERQANPEKVTLESRGLTQVPLLEGEEQLKHLILSQNQIKKIDHLVSLPNLQTLDLSSNKLVEINNFWLPGSSLDKLRTLILAKN